MKFNWIKTTVYRVFFLTPFVFITLALVIILGKANHVLAETNTQIEVVYTIRPDLEQKKLLVTAKFINIQANELLIGFLNSFVWSQYDGTDLAERIVDLNVKPDSIKLHQELNNDKVKGYRVNMNGSDTMILSYTFDTTRVPYDFHFTELTNTTLHVPGMDFFVKVFQSVREIEEGNDGLDHVKRYEIHFQDLPENWQVLTTYSQPDPNTVLIEDLWGGDVLLSAGEYKKSTISSGEATIHVALDKGLKLNVDSYMNDLERIFRHYYSIYNHIPESKILVVVNKDPRPFRGKSKSMGGQVKTRNIINSLGWGNRIDPKTLKYKILSHLAHEGHHIWYAHGFEMKDSWYWCQEGFTEYISEKATFELGLGTETHFKKALAKRYVDYNRLSIKNSISLLQASLNRNRTQEERDLFYDKGMLVAYLLDKRLNVQGKNLETFMADFYKTHAIPGLPVGNQEIIRYIDEYLGDTSFTEKYVLGTDPIPFEVLDLGMEYYWWKTERYL
ncbi:MAG: hypothetical protein MJE63_26470, partial [Proteobacteria bacterium]|nr:hypothetical protein [Pseudomonadota bacterium]